MWAFQEGNSSFSTDFKHLFEKYNNLRKKVSSFSFPVKKSVVFQITRVLTTL